MLGAGAYSLQMLMSVVLHGKKYNQNHSNNKERNKPKKRACETISSGKKVPAEILVVTGVVSAVEDIGHILTDAITHTVQHVLGTLHACSNGTYRENWNALQK